MQEVFRARTRLGSSFLAHRPGVRASAAAQPMSSRRRTRSQLISDLRLAIEMLPVHTRVAMLEGVRSNDIIVGAYVDRHGGVCPMLAAHRCGGRTDLLSFARAWDRFTDAHGRSRRATERELRILVAHLEASLLAESSGDLRTAIAEHHALMAERVGGPATLSTADDQPPARPGDPDRYGELRHRRGWAWLRPFRRLDDYQRALARVESERDALLDAAEPQRERDAAAV